MIYARIKLTTTDKKEFLSPFVYLIETAQKKLKKMKWLEVRKLSSLGMKQGKLKLVRLAEGDFPAIALYNKRLDDYEMSKYVEVIRIVEKAWEREGGEEDE